MSRVSSHLPPKPWPRCGPCSLHPQPNDPFDLGARLVPRDRFGDHTVGRQSGGENTGNAAAFRDRAQKPSHERGSVAEAQAVLS